jgi:hypothetical protein
MLLMNEVTPAGHFAMDQPDPVSPAEALSRTVRDAKMVEGYCPVEGMP